MAMPDILWIGLMLACFARSLLSMVVMSGIFLFFLMHLILRSQKKDIKQATVLHSGKSYL